MEVRVQPQLVRILGLHNLGKLSGYAKPKQRLAFFRSHPGGIEMYTHVRFQENLPVL